MSGALRGQTALVTGASRGIGRAVAHALKGAGCWVAMVARGEEELRAAAEECGGHAVPADVSQPGAVHALAGYVIELLGDVPDFVVNAAGSFALASFSDTDPDLFDAQLSANLRAPFLVSRAFLPGMLERGSGHLIQLGSVAGRVALPGNAAYGAAKFGLRGMHEVMVQELRGTGVLATLVEPAATDTSLWDAFYPDRRDDLPSRAEMLRPEAVAEAVLWAATRPTGSGSPPSPSSPPPDRLHVSPQRQGALRRRALSAQLPRQVRKAARPPLRRGGGARLR